MRPNPRNEEEPVSAEQAVGRKLSYPSEMMGVRLPGRERLLDQLTNTCTANPVRAASGLCTQWLSVQCPEGITAGKDYDRKVRYYTTKSMNGGTTFKCSLCEHTVTTLSFNSVIGNRRTQAATAMNQHAAALHLPSQLPTPTKMGGRGAL